MKFFSRKSKGTRTPNPCDELKKRDMVCKTHRGIEDYMQERVKFKINIYFCKAKRQRLKHQWFSVIIAISAALVPVLITLNSTYPGYGLGILATFFSLVVTIGVGCQELFRFREHWRNYDMIDANLRSEEMLFSMSAGPYENLKDEEKKGLLFAKRIEDLIHSERIDTITMRTAPGSGSENDEHLDNVIEAFLKKKGLLA